jgi:hypothetical protein
VRWSSNPVASTIFRNEPFGQHVEGLSHFREESYAVESAVQKHDFPRQHFALNSIVD